MSNGFAPTYIGPEVCGGSCVCFFCHYISSATRHCMKSYAFQSNIVHRDVPVHTRLYASFQVDQKVAAFRMHFKCRHRPRHVHRRRTCKRIWSATTVRPENLCKAMRLHITIHYLRFRNIRYFMWWRVADKMERQLKQTLGSWKH